MSAPRYTIAFFIDSVPFTPGVVSGRESLGGSESACLGLARALQARGHEVHLFATKLADDVPPIDDWGVTWHPAHEVYAISDMLEWDVFCALRLPQVFGRPINARLRLLWNQDLLQKPSIPVVMSTAWAYDHIVYVSEYHRWQWEDLCPDLKGLGWVTRNGYDPTHVPTDVVKKPHQIIHISRPERGLRPLLEMWPELKRRVPDATLALCRYASMYDAQGWGRICAAYDRAVAEVNASVGGITWLGELGKADLYRAIAESAVMWYPGVASFAETSCVAAIEAQACGTPLVASYRGALPETAPAAILVKGDADTEAYRRESLDAVAQVMSGCASDPRQVSRAYRQMQEAGRAHVAAYTYAAIAADWEAWIGQTFRDRYETHKVGVLRQLLHYDDHTAARRVAMELLAGPRDAATAQEAREALDRCDRVEQGLDQGAEDYARFSMADPVAEMQGNGRLQAASEFFAGRQHVLDVACGNGAFALLLATRYPHIRVTGIDYAAGNILKAQEAAKRLGVADRCDFRCAAVWDLAAGTPAALPEGLAEDLKATTFDGLFVGEFLEHVADAPGLVDHLESFVAPGAMVVYTMPSGPFMELRLRQIPLRRGHVHHFCHDDIRAVFGLKAEMRATYLRIGPSPRGVPCGHWVVSYTAGTAPARPRDYAHRILTTRPKARLSVGLITKNAECDLARCLDAVWPIADEIVVGDTGSTDETRRIAAKYDARVIDVTPVDQHPQGFAGARNDVLAACAGEWFLWIDADEQLVHGDEVWKYLESGPYLGYAIRQHHLMLDSPMTHDKPVRLFRTDRAIRFYGCIHEQPQRGDCNGDVSPALEISDVQIAHIGYLVEEIRRDKMLRRNLPLLKRDMEVFPDRRLGKLLVLRDLVNLGDYHREQARGRLTEKAKYHYAQAVGLFEQEFIRDPGDKFYALARPFYEAALRQTAEAWEIEVAIAGTHGGIPPGRVAERKRYWVRSAEDAERIIAYHGKQVRDAMTPEAVKTEPLERPPEVAA